MRKSRPKAASGSPEGALESVVATISKLRFASSDYAIFSTREGFSVKGSLLDAPDALVGVEATFLGKWGKPFVDKSGGETKTFAFSSYQIKENQTVFFLTKMVKAGITKKAALKIAKEIADLGEVIENNPEQLGKYPGIGPKKLEKVVAKWGEFKQVKRLGELLLPYGITNNMILRIFDTFGDSSEAVVVGDTYALTQIRGVGFKKADEIALRLGVPYDDHRRIKACLMFCLDDKAAGAGHTAVTLHDLTALLLEEIGSEDGENHAEMKRLAVNVLTELLDEDEVSLIDGEFPQVDCVLSASWRLAYERMIYDVCGVSVEGRKAVSDIDAWIANYEAKVTQEKGEAFKLGDRQREAVILANTLPPVLCITGYAGTGKTATSRAILELYAEKFERDTIIGCALAGIAANRLQQQSGFESNTIHSTLGYKGDDWTFNKNCPLPARVVLLDEAGMADSEITYRLMSAISFKTGAHLIIMGDDAQLDPVGAGQPFSDMVHLGLVPSVKLDHIYRADEDAVTTLFAADVRQGVCPTGLLGQNYSDFRFVDRSIPDYWKKKKSLPEADMRVEREENNRVIRNEIIQIARSHADTMIDLYNGKMLREYMTYFQVLSPVHGYDLGVELLNKELQAVLNPSAGYPEIEISNRIFRIRDKVVHLANAKLKVIPMSFYRDWLEGRIDAEKEIKVMNGQLGVVIRVALDDEDDPKVHVCYPNEGYVVIYPRDSIVAREIDHSFCLTGHKSQGSEYKNVVFPVTLSHFVMLTPKWVYTAMTRMRSHLTIVGQKYAFEIACKRKESSMRNTCLQVFARRKKDGLPAFPI